MNSQIVDMLREFEYLYTITSDTYRAKAYHNAAKSVENIDITKLNKTKIPNVGKKIYNKIDEFQRTGKVQELIELRKQAEPYKVLSCILGAGPTTIREWIKQGVTDLMSLRRAVFSGKVTLTWAQSYGLKYYDDLQKRIPREQVTEISNVVKNIVLSLFPKTQFTVCGSYRRGADTSGDIDILVSNVNLNTLEDAIACDPNYITTIAIGNDKMTILYMDSNAICRQVDIFNTTHDSYYAALVYLTGDANFEQRLRKEAKRQGYKLNQTGLWRNNTLYTLKSEREIFDILKIKYIGPTMRTVDTKIESIGS